LLLLLLLLLLGGTVQTWRQRRQAFVLLLLLLLLLLGGTVQTWRQFRDQGRRPEPILCRVDEAMRSSLF